METQNTTSKPIALVYTMHKVGSSTIMQALREIGRSPERGYRENLDYLLPLSSYEAVITPVRDPVARNVSFFFEMYGAELMDKSMKDILYEMMSGGRGDGKFTFNHSYPITWFEEFFNPVFEIDALGKRFAKKRGWSIIDGRYLLIQTERLNDKLPEAFQELFGESLPNHVHRAATLSSRAWGEVYSDFVNWVKFPPDYLDTLYESKYVKHFYLKSQIEKMRSQWE